MDTREKIIAITGASSGIGLATATGLAARGAAVVMISRDAERGKAALSTVSRAATGQSPRLLIADLSSQSSVRRLASDLHDVFPRIDVLINDAGAAFARRELTVDRIERTLAVNYLAPFLLTNLLLDLIRKSPEGRIVNVTVGFPGALGAKFLGNLQGERKYSQISAYRHTKLALIIFTYELARRLSGTGITVNCFHPGAIATKFGEKAGGGMYVLSKVVAPFSKPPDVGARMPIYLASSSDVAGVTGAYFERRVLGFAGNYKQKRTERVTYDRSVAEKLWRISEQLTKEVAEIWALAG